MAVTTLQLLAKTNHSNGTITSPSVTIPASVTSVRYYVDSSQTGVLQYNSTSQHINFQSRIDRGDGNGFVNAEGFTSDGGYHDRNGVATDPSIEASYIGEAGHQLQGTITVSGGPIRFGFFADVTHT